MDPMAGKLEVYIDNREKAPFQFPGHSTKWTTLRYGDYTAWGLKDIFEIERKSTFDMLATCVRRASWEAFLRKCARWETVVERYGASRIVLVAGNITDVNQLPYQVFKQIGARGVDLYLHRVSILCQMGVSVLYAGSPELAAKMVLRMLGRELAAREKGLTVTQAVYKRDPELAPIAAATQASGA